MSVPYTDEKHPDVVYEVVPVVEAVEPPRKRPLWRRILRVMVTFVALSMLWSTFAPVVHHHCSRMNRHNRPDYSVEIIDMGKPKLFEPSEPTQRPVQHFTFSSDLDHFWIAQESFAGVTRTNVVGKVIVASCSKAENISAHFKFDATDDDILDSIEITPKTDGIVFKLDPVSLVKQTVNATIYVVVPKKDDYKLKKFKVETIQLNVWLTKSFTTEVNSTYISTVSGHVGSHGTGNDLLNINNLKIKTTSGGIYGDFPLEHALALETTSGEIKAKIASAKRPEEIGYFKTETVSGKTTAAFDGNLNPRPLYSKHTSVSGEINIEYPEDWTGGLKIETTSGDIEVLGKGARIVKKEKGLIKKLWEVVKGEGKSKGYIGTVSGNVNALLGDKE